MNNNKITIVKSNKGKEKLFINGYDYCLDLNKDGIYRWSCSQRKSKGCKSRVNTSLVNGEHIIKKQADIHFHDPQASKISICKANAYVKDAAKISVFPPSKIILDSVIETEPECRRYLPTNNAQRKKINRARKSFIKEPTNISEIDIPEDLKFLEGEVFVLCEYNYKNEKIIILGTSESLKLLGNSTCWLMDGTFYVVPTIMRQLFTIHGVFEGHVVPLIFCLMSQKSKEAYEQFFFQLFLLAANQKIHLNPERIISDFEIAIVSAAKSFLPSTVFKGCLFHFGQILWRKVQKEGLSNKYGNDEIFNMQIRMLKSLAFVPPEEVNEYYSELYDSIHDKDWIKIANYFKKNYISNQNSGSRYDPNFWCIGDARSELFPRTQNTIEGWHNRLRVLIGKKNCGLYAIINELRKELINAINKVEKIKVGEYPAMKKINKIKHKKMRRVIKKRERTQKLEYLKSVSTHISLVS